MVDKYLEELKLSSQIANCFRKLEKKKEKRKKNKLLSDSLPSIHIR